MYSNGISRRLIRYLFAESQGFLLRKRYAITNPSGFSSRLSSHEGPKLALPDLLCGKTGIRTLGARKGTTVFETAPIDHSGIFPYITRGRTCRFVGAKVLNDFDVCNIRTCISKLFFSYSNPKRTNACIVCLLTHAAV